MLTINKENFSGNKPLTLEKMGNAVLALPSPDIISMDQFTSIQEEELVLCLQREKAYVDECMLMPTPIRYLGTKSMMHCLFAYIYTETDHLVVHIDNVTNLDLTDQVKNFNDKTDIKVLLVGGYPCPASQKNLDIILTALFNVAKQLKIKICIEKQKILSHNLAREADNYAQIFDRIFDKADILSRRYFKKPLAIEFFKERTVNDFRQRSAQPNLDVIAEGLFDAAEIMDISQQKEYEQDARAFHAIAKNEKDFLNLISALFSQEGFKLLDQRVRAKELYLTNKLRNFVIDINTKKILEIPIYIRTPYEMLRTINFMQGNSYKEQGYFMAYDKRGYMRPTLSEPIIHFCKVTKPIFSEIIIYYEDIQLTTNVDKTAYLSPFAKFIQLEFNEVLQPQYLPFQFFKTTPDILNGLSLPDEDPINTLNLEILKKITGLEFKAKIRRHPEYVVDALVECKKHDAESAKGKLKERKIDVTLIELTDKSYCLCVHAINVGHYAEHINEAKKNITWDI